MEIPHRKSTRVGLITFAIIIVGTTSWAFVRLNSFIPLIVLVIGMLALWNIARVSLHVEVLSDQLVCYQAFSTKNVSLSDLLKIEVDSSDKGTITLYFSASKIRLMQGGKMTRSIIDDILSHRSVEFIDDDNWYSSVSKTS